MRQILYHNLWYIDGIQLTKFGLLIDRTPSIYLTLTDDGIGNYILILI
jgi:hypothetical protein